MVTGWYDIFLPWQLRTYAQLVEAGNQPRLSIGAWGHVSPGMGAPTHDDTVALLREHFADAPSTRADPVRAFQTGTERCHDLSSWPPPGSTAEVWFLGGSGEVTAEPAGSGGLTGYLYEPNDPTPAVGGPSLLPRPDPVDNAATSSAGMSRCSRRTQRSEPISREAAARWAAMRPGRSRSTIAPSTTRQRPATITRSARSAPQSSRADSGS